MSDDLKLRKGQIDLLQAVKSKNKFIQNAIKKNRGLSGYEKAITGRMCPGSGKTLGWLLSANWLINNGYIDTVVCFTPRFNLCQQAEIDWKYEFRPLLRDKAMGTVEHRDNNPPFLRTPDSVGYISTYQSFIANPDIHLDFINSHRTLVVFDEAQYLGYSERENGGTKAAKIVYEKMGDAAYMFLILTGTPKRADGTPIIFANYIAQDDGLYLRCDVEYTVSDGIKEGTLRPIDAVLIDAYAVYEHLNGNIDINQLSESQSGLTEVLLHKDFWKPCVDEVVTQVGKAKTLDRRYCGLIAAVRQSHAQTIYEYLVETYPNLRCLLAISDDQSSHYNLKKFKSGNYDILITVGMAHIGYDYKPIYVIGNLSNIREQGWTHQLYARAMRWLPNSYDRQVAIVVSPNDPESIRNINEIRSEPLVSLKDSAIDELEDDSGDNQGDIHFDYYHLEANEMMEYMNFVFDGEEEDIVVLQEVQITNHSTMNFDPKNDINPDEYLAIQELSALHNLPPLPAYALKEILTSRGVNIDSYRANITMHNSGATEAVQRMASLTSQEREEAIRSAISKVCNSCNAALYVSGIIDENEKRKYTQSMVKEHFKGSVQTKVEKELLDILDWLNSYLVIQVEIKTGKKIRRYYPD